MGNKLPYPDLLHGRALLPGIHNRGRRLTWRAGNRFCESNGVRRGDGTIKPFFLPEQCNFRGIGNSEETPVTGIFKMAEEISVQVKR